MKLQKGRKAKPKKVSLTTSRVHNEKAHTIFKKYARPHLKRNAKNGKNF